MSTIFHLIISEPLYNGLILLMNFLPFDAGVIVIIFTVIIKLILLPLSIKASKSQLQMQSIQKDLDQLKEKYKDKEELSKKTIEYYKEKGVNPFASFLILLIQLPIIIGLYRIFLKSGLPEINTSMLYSFVHVPASVNMIFLGLVSISSKSLLLAIIAGATAYIQMHLASKQNKANTTGQNEMAQAMQNQMKYFFPGLIAVIAYQISAAIALYLITSNVFAIVQEMYIRKKYHKTALVV